ncbi:MAG: polysaccharide deacetylase family protein [Bacteroidetes bacterium]|nr:polysaccharide deacetylase family protein [Bacteroidota bacterium]
MYLVKSPNILRKIYGKSLCWEMPKGNKSIYLTFDDGPVPEITPSVLKILSDFNIKATFFCVGENIQKHTDVFNQILEQGHSVGNHTYNHINGWKTPKNEYIENILKSESFLHTKLFRPPYGKITPAEKKLLKKNYRIILWTILSGDFDAKTSKEQCLENVLKYTNEGAIVVFHDSIKSKEKLLYALPKFIEHFQAKGYNFEKISY